MRDFFISYTSADKAWAEWIAWTLEDAGYTHWFQDWDFRPGGNFVADMQRAATDSQRTLMVLSKSYLASIFTQPEWQAAFAADPSGSKGLLLPVRIEDCQPAGMLLAIVYCDLVGLDGERARQRLLDALLPSGRPSLPPIFPGGSSPSAATGFPGQESQLVPLDPLRSAAAELRSIFRTSGATFEAQVRVRDDLVSRLLQRLGISEHYEFEELFDRTFDRFDAQELRLHKTIRGYTTSVLHEYNQRAKRIIDDHPSLADFLPSFSRLEQHLVLWMSKYDSTFVTTPSMSLLYVGVDERVRFPHHIEAELDEFIRTGQRAAAAPEGDTASEEWAEQESQSPSYASIREQNLKRLHAIEQRLGELSELAPGGDGETAARRRLETERAYAEAVARAALPTILQPQDPLFARLRAIAAAARSALRDQWPEELSSAVGMLQLIMDDEHTGSVFSLLKALSILPILAFHEAKLGAGREPTIVWNETRDLFRRTIAD